MLCACDAGLPGPARQAQVQHALQPGSKGAQGTAPPRGVQQRCRQCGAFCTSGRACSAHETSRAGTREGGGLLPSRQCAARRRLSRRRERPIRQGNHTPADDTAATPSLAPASTLSFWMFLVLQMLVPPCCANPPTHGAGGGGRHLGRPSALQRAAAGLQGRLPRDAADEQQARHQLCQVHVGHGGGAACMSAHV